MSDFEDSDFSEPDFEDEDDIDIEMSQQSEVDDDDEEFADLKDEKEKKKWETNYKVMAPEDLERYQEDMAQRVSSLLGVSKSECMLLLEHFNWHEDSLVERFMEDADKVFNSSGLPSIELDEREAKIKKANDDFFCIICCETPADVPGMKKFSLSCNHELCTKCYGEYISSKVTTEGACRPINCFGEKCKLKLDDDSIKKLVASDVYNKYLELSLKAHVDHEEFLQWCPAPGCKYAVECAVRKSDLERIVPSVTCECGKNFCFGCQLDDHMPCACFLAAKWLKKCQDDSETSNWISANTKDCPKCHSCIEKNGGCNHMTCKKCRHEFCWMCMGDWGKHGQQYFNCSRFDENDSKTARTEQERSRAELERYLFYYNRYANHLQSLKLDRETFERIGNKMKEMQKTSGMSWIEVQFLHQGFAALQASRRTLTWTYAFAYYLQKGNKTHLFEDNQRDLEVATEQLSEIFEKPANEIGDHKVALLDKTRYVTSRREVILEDALTSLESGSWEFHSQ